MRTKCKEQSLLFQDHGARTVTAAFDGGQITADGGRSLQALQDAAKQRRGYALDKATVTRRTLTRTTPPILNRARRIVPQ